MLRNSDNDVVKDGEVVRVSMMMCDAEQRVVAQNAYRPHQGTEIKDAAQKKNDAYDERVAKLQDAWKGGRQ